MKEQRQNLLCVLQNAYVLAQNVEQLLRRFGDQHARHVRLATPVQSFLAQTIDEQRVLCECLHRIDDFKQTPRSFAKEGDVSSREPAGQSEDDALQDLDHLHALILEGIDLYHSGIETAESSGFFETRFVCEGILTQKSLMTEWLSLHTPSQTQPQSLYAL